MDVHIMGSKYKFPAFGLGSGPTQSAKTRSKGSPMAGKGYNWASGMT